MNTKKVTSTDGREVDVNYDSRKLYDYSNKREVIVYSAPIVEEGKETIFWAEFEETGIIDNIKERLQTWNNVVKLAYAKAMDYNASENDPKHEVWDNFVKLIESHPEYCFDESGDFLENFTINVEDLSKEVFND